MPRIIVDRSPLPGGWHHTVADVVQRLRRLGEVGPGTVFLVTHARSPAWRTGEAHRRLATWSSTAFVTVVHLMPQETWRQSIDPVEVGWQPSGRARTTADLAWTEEGPGRHTAAPGTVAVPVIEAGEGWLRRWVRLATGSGPVTLPGLVVSPGYRPPARTAGTPADLVVDFRASRSRTAFALAVRLAAAPLTDATMRAICRSVPGSTRVHLVEVLSSDLVRRVDDAPGGIRFDFVDGVRKRLLSFGYRDRTIAVQHLVEDALAESVPAVRGLALRIRDPHRVEPRAVDPADRPYRRVELAVHEAFSGPHLVAARRLRRALG